MGRRVWMALAACAAVNATVAAGQQCTTQSKMDPAERSALVEAGSAVAAAVQANNVTALRERTVPEVAQNFSGVANSVATTAPHLAGATFVPNTLWILDARGTGASGNGAAAGTRATDVQIYCNLNGGSQAAVFSFNALPPGRYGLVILDAPGSQPPQQLTLLLREQGVGKWLLGGFFPRATTAAGHDGLWYWKTARADAAKRQGWNAWLNYGEAERLLRPAPFVGSSHLDQLQDEQSKAAPAALSGGIGPGQPLIVKAKDGTEYRVTGLGPDDSLPGDKIDIAMHYQAEPLADGTASRQRNQRAAAALLDAYPELRGAVHGVWVYAEPQSGNPFVSEEPVSSLR